MKEFKSFKEFSAPLIKLEEHDAFKRLLKDKDFILFREYVESKLAKSTYEAVATVDQVERSKSVFDVAGAILFWKTVMMLMEELQKKDEPKTNTKTN